MNAAVQLVLNIDGDPDPASKPDPDEVVLPKYRILNRLVEDYCAGKAAMTVHTSPVFRDRFFQEPYTSYWREWAEQGRDLVIHPEDDLYVDPKRRKPGVSAFADVVAMRNVISVGVDRLRANGLPCRAFRGGSNAMTAPIAEFVARIGIDIDLSCAPQLFFPERGVDWRNVPSSAYFVGQSPTGSVGIGNEEKPLLEIPMGWDGVSPDPGQRPDFHYLANESSNLEKLQVVWDCIRERAQVTGKTQIVSMLCHTFSANEPAYMKQLKDFCGYAVGNEGEFVSLNEAYESASRQDSIARSETT
jgi:hypothetical protein